MSETASSSSRSARSAVPVVSRPLKPLDSGLSKNTGSTVSPLSDDSRGAQRDTTAQATSYLQADVGVAYSGRPHPTGGLTGGTQSDFELLKESEGDFARHVRGTSTPNDVSLTVTPSQSQSEEGGVVNDRAAGRHLFGMLTSEEILVRRESAGAPSGYLVEGGGAEGLIPGYLADGGEEGVAYFTGGDEGSMQQRRGSLRREDAVEDAIESEESKEGGGLCGTS